MIDPIEKFLKHNCMQLVKLQAKKEKLEEEGAAILKAMPMNTLEDIQKIKETARYMYPGSEKVLLFRSLLFEESRLRLQK